MVLISATETVSSKEKKYVNTEYIPLHFYPQPPPPEPFRVLKNTCMFGHDRAIEILKLV